METNINTIRTPSSTMQISADLHARFADALSKTGICIRSISQYGRSHPVIAEIAQNAQQAIAELLIVKPTVSVACTGTFFAIDSFPIEDKLGCLDTLAKSLHKHGISELTLHSGISKDELVEFAEVMSFPPDTITIRGGFANELGKRGISHIVTKSGIMPTESREGGDPANIYEEALQLVEDAMRAVVSGLKIPVAEIRAVVASSLQSLIAEDSTLLALTSIRSYDRYLSEHSVNVCILSMVFGKDMGLDPASALELGISAMLHDVGKVFVPVEIVTKPGKLSEEEWQLMRRHPAEGARVLAGLADLPALASTIALEHHVRADGTGYPSMPAGKKPHLLSRLVAIVDTYDALTTDRPYRKRWTGQQAIAWMIYEAPGQYDRQLMSRFAARANLFPPGSLVKLKRGDYAVVVGGSQQHPRKPTLRIVSGGYMSDKDSLELDLSTNENPELEIDTLAQPVEVLLPYADRLLA